MHSIISVQSPWIEIALFNRAFLGKGGCFLCFSILSLRSRCWVSGIICSIQSLSMSNLARLEEFSNVHIYRKGKKKNSSKCQIAFCTLDLSVHAGWAPDKCSRSGAASSPHSAPSVELRWPWWQRGIPSSYGSSSGFRSSPLSDDLTHGSGTPTSVLQSRNVRKGWLTTQSSQVAGARVQTQTCPLGLLSPLQLHPRGARELEALGSRRSTSSPHSGTLSQYACSSSGTEGRRARQQWTNLLVRFLMPCLPSPPALHYWPLPTTPEAFFVHEDSPDLRLGWADLCHCPS